MLASIRGKPILQWVWEAAQGTGCFNTIAFAIDSEETAALIRSFGGAYHMTPETCPSGTDRLADLEQRGLVEADIYVNWQGDEPFIKKQMIETLVQSCHQEKSDVWTLKKRLHTVADIQNPHIAKVVCDAQGFALYFSRSVIPHYRDPRPEEQKLYFKHIGIYAYTREALRKIRTLPSCYLEEAENLEQLRFLYNGLRIRVHETECEAFGIDLPEHLAQAETFLFP